MNDALYKKFAKYYDKLYENKNYIKEIRFIDKIVKRDIGSKRRYLLDVACGTGNHTLLFKRRGYVTAGIDNSSEMLRIARKKNKLIEFIKADMKNFSLKNNFDVIVCLFASINYLKNYNDIKKTLTNFYNQLKNKGTVIFDIGINNKNLEKYMNKKPTYYLNKNLKIVRFTQYFYKTNRKFLTKKIFMFVKDKKKIDFSIDESRMLLIDINKVRKMMQKIGFDVKIYDNFSFKEFNNKGEKPVFVGIKQ